ncbi:MAG: aspartyl protease [Leptolyngbya sp. SIO4C1]|nr:aspartyl protease [Leptolyngbya sp. SIO4C1]
MSRATTANEGTDKVIISLTLTNWIDQVLTERDFILAEQVRSITVDDALVDMGATRLCLPADIIQQLGLKLTATIDAQTATGPQTVNVYEGLKLTVEGREGRYDCVELPAGQTPLLGLIPLEDLGLEPDLQNQRPRHLTTTGKETYMTVL